MILLQLILHFPPPLSVPAIRLTQYALAHPCIKAAAPRGCETYLRVRQLNEIYYHLETMASLPSLPTELLHRVASLLPFSAFIQLQCVNRRLHAACNDHLLCKNVARDSFMNTPGALKHLLSCFSSSTRVQLSPEDLNWPEGSLFLAKASPAEVTRVAYAVQRCTMLSEREQEASTLSQYKDQELFDTSTWLPQLLALHHPAALNLEPTGFLNLFDQISNLRHDDRPAIQRQREAELVNAQFILCYLTLQRLSTTRHSALYTLQLFERHFFPMMDGSDEHAPSEAAIIDKTIRRISGDTPRRGIPRTSLSPLEASSILLPMILHHCAHFKLKHENNYLPKPRQIPFNTFMDVRPIYEDFAHGFNKCHIRGMTSPEFIAGTWTGINLDWPSMSSRPQFGGDMMHIRLVTRPPREGDDDAVSVIIDRSSGGLDSDGQFTLKGRILKSGAVYMAKRYILHPWNWNWTGHVTPFGLVGVWPGAAVTGGLFWMWKSEWGVDQ